ncbi:MAG: hypothetical protein AAFQ50_10955 [Pseudomonadota bacterium]
MTWKTMGTRLSLAASLFCASVLPGMAEGRLAYLLAPAGEGAPTLSRAFLEAGYDVSRQVWDGTGALPVLTAPRGVQIVLHIGQMDPDQGAAVMRAATEMRRRGAASVLVVSESCATWPTGDDGAPDVSVVAPLATDDGCAAPDMPMARALQDGLQKTGAPMSAGMAGVFQIGTMAPLTDAAAPRRSAQPVVIGAASMAVQPATLGVRPVAFPGPVGAAQPVTGGTLSVVSLVQPAALLSARATPDGLPRPSIIVGVIREDGEEAPSDDAGILSGNGLDTDTFDARERMRADDPEAYAGLVASGAFDPAPDALPTSLQQILQRMACYRLRIDGDWGNGSRAAVDRYYAERGSAAPTREASIDLFRDVILREDITCPAPVVRAPRPTANAGGTRTTRRAAAPARSNAAAAPRRAQPAPQRAQQPAASSGGNGGRISGSTFNGVFR